MIHGDGQDIMSALSVAGSMSSIRSSHSPVDGPEDELRRKGSRGGKRSVTHLSKAQLARKRANDREAQRNIRQRTKEHIENLEKKVKDLECNHRSSSVERILKRNQELEGEIERLRAQLQTQQSSTTSSPIPQELPEDLLVSQKVALNWTPELSRSWPGAVPSHIHGLESNGDVAVSSPYAHSEAPTYVSDDSHIYPARHAVAYDRDETEASQTHYTAMATQVWEDPIVYGAQTTQSLTRPVPAWTPYQASTPEPPVFPTLQQPGFPINASPNHAYSHTSCWQNQPSVYAWQLSTKLKAPVTQVDQLMFAAINCQRHLAITADVTGEDLLGPDFPSVHLLFNQPGPQIKVPSSLTEVMERYSAVLTARGFALIPEKLASFMCMYRFVQWQVSPSYETYKALYEWQAPRPAQLVVPHPAWMDLAPWGKLREKLINNQELYDTPEFQQDYASNLSVNFPHDPMEAVVFVDGQIIVSKTLEGHIRDISHFSMKRPFADKYPEFRDVCRFDEV